MPVVLAPLLVGFAVIVGAFVLYGMHQAASVWLRSLIQNLPQSASFLRAFNRAPVVSLIEKGTAWLFHRTRKDVADALVARLAPLAHWLSALGTRERLLLNSVSAVAEDTVHALSWLRHQTVPHLIRRAVAPVASLARTAERDARRSISLVHKAERDFTRGIDRLAHRLEHFILQRVHGIDRLIREHVLPRIRRAEHAITVTLPRRIARVEGRLGRIEKALGLGVMAALVYRVLARVAPWIFCRNVKKLGNVACGLRASEVDALIAGLLGVLALTDIRSLARLMEETEEEAARAVRAAVRAF